MKYGSGYRNHLVISLDQSEYDMLSLTRQRAQIADRMDILEPGCGRGSLIAAEQFPKARITGISHSRTQKSYIEMLEAVGREYLETYFA
jgi:cyclopropane-fatty-acyl-phospholipid synthase